MVLNLKSDKPTRFIPALLVTDLVTLGREDILFLCSSVFSPAKWAWDGFPAPGILGKSQQIPAGEGAQGIVVDLIFPSSGCVRSPGVFYSSVGRGMVGQDQVSPLARTPRPPGSSKFGNLGSRQT